MCAVFLECPFNFKKINNDLNACKKKLLSRFCLKINLKINVYFWSI